MRNFGLAVSSLAQVEARPRARERRKAAPARQLALAAALLTACADPRPISDTISRGDAGRSVDAGTNERVALMPPDPCGSDNPYCQTDAGRAMPAPACDSQKYDLRPVSVNVVVAVDGSMSMNTFWTQIRDAVGAMMAQNPSIAFGADLFWADTVESVDEGFKRINACGDTQHKLLALGLNQSAKLPDFFGAEPPGPGIFFWDFTPVAEPLNYYLVNKTSLSDPHSTNYLVFISDGNDNCFGSFFAGEGVKELAYEKLARELVKKNIRVLPIGFNGASDQISLDGGVTYTDFTALDTLAKFGGSGVDKALAADNPDQLKLAIATVAQRIRSCRFQIPAALDPSQSVNPFALDFLVNGQVVARDRTQQQGFNFVDGNISEVEFFGNACQAVRAGMPVEAREACDKAAVCGNAASKVMNKPRVVEYLLGRSFQMARCSVGFLQCVPGITPGETWWGVAAASIAASVTAPINDDVEFGLKYMPDSNQLDCSVSDGPDLAPAPGMAIALIGNMLHNLPGGGAPLLVALEKVAANPGRLSDPSVSGALVVVSDSAESCEDIDQATKLMRLTAAAGALKAKGVRVFVVRFGKKGDSFAEQDAQLRAIAVAGGTASGDASDPNNTPYLEAPDADSLTATLASISEQLAACTLELGALDPKADKTQVNLYLNGEVISFDSQGAKRAGWGWSDPAQTTIELYGQSCDAFKTNRTTSIIVEVGCTPVIVI